MVVELKRAKSLYRIGDGLGGIKFWLLLKSLLKAVLKGFQDTCIEPVSVLGIVYEGDDLAKENGCDGLEELVLDVLRLVRLRLAEEVEECNRLVVEAVEEDLLGEGGGVTSMRTSTLVNWEKCFW